MERRQPDQWDLVIKVKHGDTLRRIGAYVNGQLMDPNISKLRAKIISLFKFSHDADFILTYTDEDGDTVTLDDDDELRDAVISQHLNPLRINVQLKSTDARSEASSPASTDARSEASSPANSTKPRTPTGDQQPRPTLEPLLGVVSNLVNITEKAIKSSPALAQKVDEVMHSEPFKSAMKNIPKDVTNAISPALAQVVEQISSLGLSTASGTSGPTGQAAGGSGATSTPHMDRVVANEPKASKGLTTEADEITSSDKMNPSALQGAGSAVPSADPSKDAPKVTTAMYPLDDLLASMWTTAIPSEHGKEIGSSSFDGKSVSAAENASPPFGGKAPCPGTFWSPAHQYPTSACSTDLVGGDSNNNQLPAYAHSVSPLQGGFNPHPEVPISERINQAPPAVFSTAWGSPLFQHFQQYYPSHIENTSRTFHRGVRCDGCGMHPIVGPRFKSKVKLDYDLCNICFIQMGNETDYTRIERSHRASHKHPRCRFPSPNMFGVKPPRGKLESRFIQDVTIMDGTVISPLTHFTKIWRLRNNGTLPWPLGTQLVWVGGDQFSNEVSAELEIPANGFPIDQELDIAVDFTAPSRPGRYVSYWRLASPSGQKFGQRVWVLIQVDISRPNSAAGSGIPSDLNLNLPLESSGQDRPRIIDVNAEPLLDTSFPDMNVAAGGNVPVTTTEPVENILGKKPKELVGGLLMDAHDDSLTVSYPLVDLQATSSAGDINPVEQTMLKELEEMGFGKTDLNKEVLRLNEYDLEQSVDDLCGFSDWNPILSELHDMGFRDKELNKKLLIKNGGSIKRVVLDLIAGKMVE